MAKEELPNVQDRDIRQMVLRNHGPEEFWTANGDFLEVHCSMCHNLWPCQSILLARNYQQMGDDV